MTRRELLFLSGACLRAQAPVSSDPQNISFPLQSIEGSVTPADLFFVRDHFHEPVVSLSAWRLKIEGRVTRPLELSLADLIEFPTTRLEAILECAGNVAGGSAVSNGVWEGASLPHLLRIAGAQSEAETVVLEGADSGRLREDAPTLPYSQIVPFEKCLQPGSLVAFKLNDRFLPRRNGFPARAMFPGWYAMDSVKWLRRITVLGPKDQPSDFEASGMNKLYNRVLKSAEGPSKITRLSEILVKSAISWPTDSMKLPVGEHKMRGFAWTGPTLVRSVEISTDGGRAWTPARLEGRPQPFSWIRWYWNWAAAPGDYVLMSRATDDSGRQQPLSRDPIRKDGYELNYCARVRCSVR